MSAEHLCLKWNNFENNIANYLDVLRNENDFVDVTITCGEKNFKAHKVILSACSPYFRGIFQENPCSHPIIILKNVASSEMEAILQYIYTGETYITKDDLGSFLNTANLLQIIGLINYHLYDPDTSLKNGILGVRGNEFLTKKRLSGHGHKDSNSQNHSSTHSHSNCISNCNSNSNNNNNNNNNSSSSLSGNPSAKANLVVKKFANRAEDSPPFPKKGNNSEGAPKNRRPSPPTSDSEHGAGDANGKTEDTCPILSKQLLLPKKRKLSVIDQNKNEFYENSELSNSSEDTRENGTILRNCLEPEKPEIEEESDEETYTATLTIKKETVETENVLEPEVGLCVKEENEFESTTSEESLHNGDILLQRLQSYQGEEQSENSEESLKVPKPDVSIFSKNSSKIDGEGENLTLTPNVEIFLRNANNSTDNLIHKLAKINLFKAKQFKKLKKPIMVKPDVMAGTSKCADKDSGPVKNGIGSDGKGFHLTNLPCPHCTQVYNNLSALKYHVRLMHSDLENKLFCHLCPMNFIEREYFKIHLWEAHNARF